MTRLAGLMALLLAVSPLAAADAPKWGVQWETADPPTELKPAIRALLADRALRVTDSAGAYGTLWLRKDLPAKTAADRGKTGLTYRAIAPAAVIGAVQFEKPWVDYRQQEIPAGVYTLRLAIQPASKDHEGTAPHREFCILTPAAQDATASEMPLKKLIALSSEITGGTHPLVMMLAPNPTPNAKPAIADSGKGVIALSVKWHVKVGEMNEDIGFAFVLANPVP